MGEMNGPQVPWGWEECFDPAECKTYADFCGFATRLVDIDEKVDTMMEGFEGSDEDRERTRKRFEEMQRGPPIAPLCTRKDQCGQKQYVEEWGPEFIVECDDRDSKDDDDRRGGDKLGDNYIEMNKDGIRAGIKAGRDVEIDFDQNNRGDISVETETGPIRTRTKMERGDFDMEADVGDGMMKIMIEAGDNGNFKVVMLNAKALATTLISASAMCITLF